MLRKPQHAEEHLRRPCVQGCQEGWAQHRPSCQAATPLRRHGLEGQPSSCSRPAAQHLSTCTLFSACVPCRPLDAACCPTTSDL